MPAKESHYEAALFAAAPAKTPCKQIARRLAPGVVVTLPITHAAVL